MSTARRRASQKRDVGTSVRRGAYGNDNCKCSAYANTAPRRKTALAECYEAQSLVEEEIGASVRRCA